MRSLKFRRRERKTVDIAMAPLIDLIFLLLIFFLVSTTFTRETGVEVDRPQAQSGEEVEDDAVYVAVTTAGTIHFENQRVFLPALRDRLARALGTSTRKVVIVLADSGSRTGLVVEVMDQCRRAGAQSVFIATRSEDSAG